MSRKEQTKVENNVGPVNGQQHETSEKAGNRQAMSEK